MIDWVPSFCLVQHILEVAPKEVHVAVNLLNVFRKLGLVQSDECSELINFRAGCQITYVILSIGYL